MGRGGYDLTPTTTTPPPHTHNLSGIMGKQILDTQTREPLGILDIYTEHDGKINQRLDVCFQECTHTFRPAKSGPQERDHSSVVSERNQYCFLLCLIVPCLSYICLGISVYSWSVGRTPWESLHQKKGPMFMLPVLCRTYINRYPQFIAMVFINS